MPVIFGWGHQKIKNLGPVILRFCSHCRNESYWNLTVISTWFTLFFIPIFPYSIKKLLTCSVCAWGFQLENEQFEKIKQLAENNKLLSEQKITEQEYQERLGFLTSGDEVITPPGVPRKIPVTVEKNNKQSVYCVNCGDNIGEGHKFCKKCGAEVIK